MRASALAEHRLVRRDRGSSSGAVRQVDGESRIPHPGPLQSIGIPLVSRDVPVMFCFCSLVVPSWLHLVCIALEAR